MGANADNAILLSGRFGNPCSDKGRQSDRSRLSDSRIRRSFIPTLKLRYGSGVDNPAGREMDSTTSHNGSKDHMLCHLLST